MPTDHDRYDLVPPAARWWDQPWFTTYFFCFEDDVLSDIAECEVEGCGWFSTPQDTIEDAEREGRAHMRDVHGVLMSPQERREGSR